jgi:hypothetical protein
MCEKIVRFGRTVEECLLILCIGRKKMMKQIEIKKKVF